MPYKVPQLKVEQQLTREVAHKLVELQQAQHEQERLIYQADVLHHIVQYMGCLCQGYCADGVKAEPLDGRGDEALLLEQLGNLTCVAPPTVTAAVSTSAAAEVKLEATHAPPLGHVQPLRSTSSLCSTCSSSSAGSEDKQATAAADGTAAAGTSRSGGGGQGAPLENASMGDAASFDAFSQQQQQQRPLLHQTIAPDGDHLAVFRHLVSLPPYEGAESITLQQMQQEYASLVCELMLHVALLEEPQLQGGCDCGEQSLRAVAALVMQHLHLLTTLLLQQRGDLLQAFYLSDCLTGEVGDQQQLQVVSTAVSQVQLNAQQRQEVSDIMVVFQRLLAPLIATRQQLQTNPTSASSAGAGSSSSSSDGGSFGWPEDEAGLESPVLAGRGSLLQQQARVAGLSMVMRKELFLKACCFGITIGRLEWLQVARLIIAIFPFPMAMSVVGQEISRQFGEQQQQQSLRQQQLRRAQEAVRSLHKGRRRGKKRAQ